MMLPPNDELSTDLEFLLQNGETTGLALIEALVREYYAPVYRLALAICDDPDSATYAAIETFISATLQVEEYRAEEGVSTWLYSQTIPICRREYRKIRRRRTFKAALPFLSRTEDFGASLPDSQLDATLWLALDALPEQKRLAALLHHLMDMSEVEIANILKVEEKEVLSRLVAAHRSVWQKYEKAGISIDEPEPFSLDKLLSASLARRCPQPEFSSEEFELLIQEIQAQVSKRSGRRQRWVYGKEIILTAFVSLLAVGLIWGVSRLLPEPESATFADAANQAKATPMPGPSATPWRVINLVYSSPGGESIGSVAEKLDLPLSALVVPRTGLQITHDPAETLQPDETLEFRVRSDAANLPTSTPVPPIVNSQPPLNAQSSLEQVRSRIAQSESLWHTLWADVSIIDYGPQGYSGPVLQTTRIWTWLQLPDKSLTKLFANGSPYSYPYLVNHGISYDFIGSSVNAVPQEELLAPGLGDLLLPARSEWFKHGDLVRVLSQGSYAGRQVIIVQWEVAADALEYQPSPVLLDGGSYMSSLLSSYANEQTFNLLLTIDAQTGVVLRLRQYFDTNGRSTLVQETAASQIAFDVDFQQPGLFDPLVTGLLEHTRDYRGRSYSDIPEYVPAAAALGHEQLTRSTPAPGYDPSGDLLTFQYPADSHPADNPAQDGIPLREVDLFARGYFLRSLQLPPINMMICDRSPDGSTIAYLTGGDANTEFMMGFGNVKWLDLRQPAEIHTPASKFGVADLAFSPQGRYLALAGYEAQTGDIGIYLLDTNDGTMELLQTAVNAWGLVWSPDGKYLAFIGTVSPEGKTGEGQLAAAVLDVSSKKITYHAEIPDAKAYIALLTSPNTQHDWLPPDWPVYQWGVQFPVIRSTLGNCPEPPRIPPPP